MRNRCFISSKLEFAVAELFLSCLMVQGHFITFPWRTNMNSLLRGIAVNYFADVSKEELRGYTHLFSMLLLGLAL